MQFSGLFNHVHKDGHSFIGEGSAANALRRLGKRRNFKQRNEVAATLVNGDVGDTANATRSRVAAHNPSAYETIGGVRHIEASVVIDRATTSDDAAKTTTDLLPTMAVAFPADKSGSGGGGKLGF